jgi:forkhead transcription factor HCM1
MHAREVCSSPPPIQLGSSPPPIVNQPISRAPERDGTPPPVPRFPGTSRSGGRKRKFAAISGLGDSGYYSSIDSSIQREHRPHLLTSDVDLEHPTRKRGRAEEEIARIRSSSYDSPSKVRTTLRPSTAAGISSSPFRPFEPPKAPLTPPEVFKKPARPIASVSPNTNLKNHRNKVKQMLASPNVQPLSPDMPNLDIDVNEYNVYGPSGTNHFFYDHFLDTTLRSAADRGSPEKRPSKRSRLERANTTASILADVTGARSNIGVSPVKTPKLNQTLLRSPERFWPSPIKPTQKLPTSHPVDENTVPDLQLPQDDNDYLFGVDLPSDASEPGVDIMQGFQKIGAPVPISSSSALAPPPNLSCHPSQAKRSDDKASGRSSFGRSLTALF